MNKDIFDANMQVLEKSYQGWCQRIQEGKYEAKQQYQVAMAQAVTGEQIVKVTKEDYAYYMSGKYAPLMEAEDWNDIHNTGNEYGVYIFLGSAEVYKIRALLEHSGSEVGVIIYEPDVHIFLQIMESIDITDLLEDKRVIWVVEEINGNEWPTVLEMGITLETMPLMRMNIMGNYVHLYKEEIEKAIFKIKKRIEDVRITWNTWIRFNDDTWKNILRNMVHMYDHHNIQCMRQFLPPDIPSIVVAAGPSLEKNIDELHKAKGKACIIACDTALKPLLSRGIVPDFFLVVDPRKPLKLFDRPEIKHIPVITGLGVPAEVLKEHVGKKIIYFDTDMQIEILEHAVGKAQYQKGLDDDKQMAGLSTGGSVATSAFSFGRILGSDTIILVGQDLAMTGNKSHADGTFEEKMETIDTTGSDYVMVENIHGEMVPTLTNLKYYLEWYEQAIEGLPEGVRVIDATEGGALIHGSELMTLREAIERECTKEVDIAAMLEDIPKHFDDAEKENVRQFFADLPKELRKIENRAKKGCKSYRQLESLLKKSKEPTQEQLKKVLDKITKVNHYMDESRLANFVMSGLSEMDYTVRVNLLRPDDDELLETAKSGLAMLEGVCSIIQTMLPIAEEVTAPYREEKEKK